METAIFMLPPMEFRYLLLRFFDRISCDLEKREMKKSGGAFHGQEPCAGKSIESGEEKMVYLDNAATTRVSPRAAEAASRAMVEQFGNPSSLHRLGIEAEELLRNAREKLAERLGASKNEFVFTSGGTEGNNLAILGAARAKARKGKHMITTMVEHASVLSTMRELEKEGFRVTYLPPEQISPEGVMAALCEDTILLSIMSVNNEVGTVYPISEIARAAKRSNPELLVHTDAVQAFMKIPIRLRDGAIDLLTVSGHKIHAPKGVGALYIRRGVRIAAHNFGGGQERGLRPGTENVPAIAGFGAALDEAADAEGMKQVLQYLKEKLAAMPQVKILVCGDAPHILSLAIPGYPSEVAMRMLESRGIYLSSGSACSRGQRSHVLEALHIPPQWIESALRLSICRETTKEDADLFCTAVQELFGNP